MIPLSSYRLGLFPSPFLERDAHQGRSLRHQLRHGRKSVKPRGRGALHAGQRNTKRSQKKIEKKNARVGRKVKVKVRWIFSPRIISTI